MKFDHANHFLPVVIGRTGSNEFLLLYFYFALLYMEYASALLLHVHLSFS